MPNKEIIEQFKKKGISLKDITGTLEFAFRYSEVIEILNFCKNNNIGIWGGDVLDINSKAKYTGNNWYINAEKNMHYKEFVEISIEKTKEYIRLLPNFEMFLYALVFCDNAEEYTLSLESNGQKLQ
jgi:hypothetical protein